MLNKNNTVTQISTGALRYNVHSNRVCACRMLVKHRYNMKKIIMHQISSKSICPHEDSGSIPARHSPSTHISGETVRHIATIKDIFV